MTKRLLILTILVLIGAPAFAQSVDTAWTRGYNGSANGEDRAWGMTIDGSGNVYVTGWSEDSVTSIDYTTIKYYPNGDTAWLRRYDRPGGGWDYANAIAADGSGNVYVTGFSWGSGTYYDYATVKYDSSGNELWVSRYNGPADDWDEAKAIAVDGFGNVYVTGRSYGIDADRDYTTLKYDSSGNELWVKRYNGPGDSTDRANAVAVDGFGNVYVTGRSIGDGSQMDYATIKYDSSGNELWVRRYNGPGNDYDEAYAIAVDASGNVCVSGYSYGSGTSYDYATIKYYPDGDTAWVRRYNGPGGRSDLANAITVDASGNVYVAGYSYGSTLTENDYSTIKYDQAGNEIWVGRYNGPRNDNDDARAITVDSYGNVYVTGLSKGIGTHNDYATIKYYPDGNTAWVRRYSSSGYNRDHANAIAVDNSGNVYVTGESRDEETDYDFATIKYFEFLRGDVDKNGEVNVVDVVYLVNYVFKSGPVPIPAPIVGDANCDSNVDIEDVVYLINYLFRSGPPPCQ